ncbi:MAG: ABC transporter permease [Candidatus Sulfotelmatobacter sp.]
MSGLIQDVRYALRQLRKSPVFTLVAVLTLALGIGANTAIFSVVEGVLLRPLPYRDSDQLVRVWSTSNRSSRDVSSYPDFKDWADQNHSFQQMAAYRGQSFNLSGGDHPERIRGLLITSKFFELLDVKPILGRAFTSDEHQFGRNHVLLLSSALWQSHFAGDSGVLGRSLKLDDESYTVIGVLPSSFDFPPDETKGGVVLPLQPDMRRTHGFLYVFGRLKPNTTLASAQADVDTIARRLAGQYKEDKGQGVSVQTLQASFVSDYRPALMILLGAVGLVLLITCANVANLFVGRASSRQRELAVRASLGAGRLRLMRQLLTESLLIGLAGGTVGLVFANWGVSMLVRLLTQSFSIHGTEAIATNLQVLAFAAVISIMTGLISGLLPALFASKVNLSEGLKEGSRSVGSGRAHKRFRGALVVSEVALALVLLCCAGLLIRSLMLLTRVDSGVQTENVMAIDLSLTSAKYSHTATRAALFSHILQRVGQLPGVESAAVVADVPLTQNEDSLGFSIEGVPDPPERKLSVRFNIVGPGYFTTLGIPLTQGRDFADTDADGTPMVIVVNQAMARRFWPKQNPIGRRITTDNKTWYSIIGVAGDVRQMGLRADSEPEVYMSYQQDPFQWPYLSLLVRARSNPVKLFPSIEQAVWSVDKEQPLSHPITLDQARSHSIAQPRIAALLLGLFAAAALLLAAVGLYGVVSYWVAERTHEIGVRMALGARSFDVFVHVVGRGLLLALLGTAFGLAGSLAVTRVLASFLFSVRSTDPLTFAAVALLLMCVALVASYFPARRAAKVDPMVALRYE